MTPDTAPTEAPDPAILRAEWRLRMIEELAEIGMDLARDLHRQTLAAADPAEPGAADTPETRRAIPGDDPAEAFARLSRAVRLSLALHARTDEALRALRAGVAVERETRRVEAGRRAAAEVEARSKSHRHTVERLVIEAAEREVEDDDSLGDVMDALEQRLEEDEAYWDLDQMPLREAVERLCADLELNPDWSQWGDAGWPPKPPFSRFKFRSGAAPAARPWGISTTERPRSAACSRIDGSEPAFAGQGACPPARIAVAPGSGPRTRMRRPGPVACTSKSDFADRGRSDGCAAANTGGCDRD